MEIPVNPTTIHPDLLKNYIEPSIGFNLQKDICTLDQNALAFVK